MNEQQNMNNPAPKPKRKRSFWWLKLLLILILFAAGVIAGIMLSSQAITNRIMEQYFPQYAVSEPVTTPMEIKPTEKPIEYKASPTPIPSPKASKAPLEIISPEAQEKAELPEISAAPEITEAPEATDIPEVTDAAASPVPSIVPAFGYAGGRNPASAQAPGAELIGIDAALDAALEHAGFQTEEVFVYSVSRERDDGLVYYEVEFGYDGKEYEYEINAYSGVVESWKTVRADKEEFAAAASGNVLDLSSCVSVDDAKKTALYHAGYEEYETKDMLTHLEIENNKLVYEIEFRAEGYDYDYKIDATTGLVIMLEKERD